MQLSQSALVGKLNALVNKKVSRQYIVFMNL